MVNLLNLMQLWYILTNYSVGLLSSLSSYTTSEHLLTQYPHIKTSLKIIVTQKLTNYFTMYICSFYHWFLLIFSCSIRSKKKLSNWLLCNTSHWTKTIVDWKWTDTLWILWLFLSQIPNILSLPFYTYIYLYSNNVTVKIRTVQG